MTNKDTIISVNFIFFCHHFYLVTFANFPFLNFTLNRDVRTAPVILIPAVCGFNVYLAENKPRGCYFYEFLPEHYLCLLKLAQAN